MTDRQDAPAAEPAPTQQSTGAKVLTELRTTLTKFGERVAEGTAKGARAVGAGAERLARQLEKPGPTPTTPTDPQASAPIDADTPVPPKTPRPGDDGATDLRASLQTAGAGISHAAQALAKRTKEETPRALEGAKKAGVQAMEGAKKAGERIATAAQETKRKIDASELPARAQRATGKVKVATGTAYDKIHQAAVQTRDAAVERWSHREETLQAIEQRMTRLKDDLARRVKEAKEKGVDFFQQHREEILALIITAGKVAVVIGIRRLTAPPEKPQSGEEEKDEGKRRLREKNRRLQDAAMLMLALTREVGRVFAYNPSSLPLLREAYEKGDESQQTVVGMLLGPSLQSDPDHGVQVIREFLEAARGTPAADSIARRSLAPLIEQKPSLVEKVVPWVQATQPLVKRAALIALERHLADKRSRVGDIVAASVVILEDHDEEVRQAFRWLLATASGIDRRETARTLVGTGKEAALDELLPGLPEELREEVGAVRRAGAGSPPG